MKITKKSLNENQFKKKKINEAADFELDDLLMDIADDTVISAKQSAKTTETKPSKEEVKTQVSQVAKEVKQLTSFYDIETFAPLGVTNAFTEALDDSLEDALVARGELLATLADPNIKELPENLQTEFKRLNILCEGLPGSGKTAIAQHWASQRGINLHPVNAKSPDLETAINGLMLRDHQRTDTTAITKAYSHELAPLMKKNSVLFLDELNRQTKDQIRATLLTLLAEHSIYGHVDINLDEHPEYEPTIIRAGNTYFPNLLFTVACINPAVPQDKGAAKLNDAEMSRFSKTVKFDSTPQNCANYIEWYYKKRIEAVKKQPNNPYHDITIIQYKLRQFLGKAICTDPAFKFDTRDDLQDLYNQSRTMFNQRLFCDVLDQLKTKNRYGEDMITQLTNWIGKNPDSEVKAEQAAEYTAILDGEEVEKRSFLPTEGMSNILDRDKSMLHTILKSIVLPKFTADGEEKPEDPEEDEIDLDGEEEDQEIFIGGTETNMFGDSEMDQLMGQFDTELNNTFGN